MRANPLSLVPDYLVEELVKERERQFEKFGDQSKVPDGTGGNYLEESAINYRHECQRAFRESEGTWRHILAEEVAEAMAESDAAKLRTELIQVAAVACAWIQVLDKRGAL